MLRSFCLNYFNLNKNLLNKMNSQHNINDLLVNLKPKILRFTGEKFPAELWTSSSLKPQKKITIK